MGAGKTQTLNLRVTLEFKELLRDAAAAEHRSQTNLLEKLVRDHCASAGMVIAYGGSDNAPPPPSTTTSRSV